MPLSCKALVPVNQKATTQLAFLLYLVLVVACNLALASVISREQGTKLHAISTSSGWNIQSWRVDTDPCDRSKPWDGILCNAVEISTLNLTRHGLSGPLPRELFSALPNLTHLILGQNNFSGSIPDTLFGLALLTELDLSYNQFSGALPADLARLTSLEVLSLTRNGFDSLSFSLSSFSNLQYLLLGGNSLQGQFPVGINDLTKLVALDLERNKFARNCHVPKDVWKTSVQVMGLEGNDFVVDWPDWPEFSPSLKYLSLPQSALRSAPQSVRNLLPGVVSQVMCVVLPKWILCNPPTPAPLQTKKGGLSALAIVGITLGSTILFFATLFSSACFMYQRWKRNVAAEDSTWLRREAGSSSSDPNAAYEEFSMFRGPFPLNTSRQIFTYRELQFACNNFDEKQLIGEGGFGRVYRAMLSTGKVVAIKQMDDQICGAQGEREFRVEVDMLSRLNHPNLVKLLGYCADSRHRLIVYDYMPNGSLHDYLKAKQAIVSGGKLDMHKRLLIAYGAAKALDYLHSGAGLGVPIVHRDFKSSNILLDSGFQARVSDFGLARVMTDPRRSHVSTRVIGTFGYFDPEYTATGQLTSKSDVYAFGVVLLQLLTGMPPVVKGDGDESGQGIVSWATPFLTEAKMLRRILDLDLGEYSTRSAVKLANLARLCVKDYSTDRPSMLDCVKVLEKILLEANSLKQRRLTMRKLLSKAF